VSDYEFRWTDNGGSWFVDRMLPGSHEFFDWRTAVRAFVVPPRALRDWDHLHDGVDKECIHWTLWVGEGAGYSGTGWMQMQPFEPGTTIEQAKEAVENMLRVGADTGD